MTWLRRAGGAALVVALSLGSTGMLGLVAYLEVEQSNASTQAQANQQAAISALARKDNQIDLLRRELEQVLAAPTPAARATVVQSYAPPPAAPARPAPTPTTTTTTRPPPTSTTTTTAPPPRPHPNPPPPPAPCTTLPVVGGCLP